MDRRYSVYVIELDPAVLNVRKFAEANPGHRAGKPCVYVGMTARTPAERFEQHQQGKKANRYAKKFGRRLRVKNFAHLNPMTYEDAQKEERALAARLRKRGYGVWQN